LSKENGREISRLWETPHGGRRPGTRIENWQAKAICGARKGPQGGTRKFSWKKEEKIERDVRDQTNLTSKDTKKQKKIEISRGGRVR